MMMAVGHRDVAVRRDRRLLVEDSCVQRHQLLLGQLLDDGGRVAVAQHVVGGANAVAVLGLNI